MNHAGMRYSLVSRELIADSIEAVMYAHAYDGLIGFAGCDKTLSASCSRCAHQSPIGVHVRRAALPVGGAAATSASSDVYEGVGACIRAS